jgi:four helix bundle protein
MADAYRDPIAWRKATDLALEIYRATQKFPIDEPYGLTSQMRRAAISVAGNIAEGKGRYSRKRICAVPVSCSGFPARTRNPIVHSKELHYLEPLAFRRMEDRTKELGRILNGLINSVLEGINVASCELRAESCEPLSPFNAPFPRGMQIPAIHDSPR